ncbi:hypothetical protein TUM17560_49070 [Serratia marcescens]|nr:hypothetical protein TUM17560_49070 [Serratia marcescens]
MYVQFAVQLTVPNELVEKTISNDIAIRFKITRTLNVSVQSFLEAIIITP